MKQKHNNAWSENTTKMMKTILIRVVQHTQSEQHHFTPPASLRKKRGPPNETNNYISCQTNRLLTNTLQNKIRGTRWLFKRLNLTCPQISPATSSDNVYEAN